MPPSGRKAGKRLLYNFIGYTTRMHMRQTLLQGYQQSNKQENYMITPKTQTAIAVLKCIYARDYGTCI
ncbi:hypothetical protein DWZ75_13730, partial [Bacteroides stercoris]